MTKRGKKFAYIRADWTKYPYIAQMYDVIYNEFVADRLAVTLDTPVFADCHGNEVEEGERFELQQDIKITHPHMIIFCDESG